MIDLLTSIGAFALAAGAPVASTPQHDEVLCIVHNLPSSARRAIVEVMATGDRARTDEVMKANAAAGWEAIDNCARRFEWSEEERQAATKAFEFGLRFEASLIRLPANGLTEETASKMYESLPVSMHEAIFFLRPITAEEADVLRSAFEPLVERLDGPDGNALSEYITARSGYEHYAGLLVGD